MFKGMGSGSVISKQFFLLLCVSAMSFSSSALAAPYGIQKAQKEIRGLKKQSKQIVSDLKSLKAQSDEQGGAINTLTQPTAETSSKVNTIYVTLKGGTGSPGGTGEPGQVGPQGEQGEVGPQGEQGETGPAGPKGDQGPAGPAGAQGPQGPIGPTGLAGATGAQGPQGLPGATGAQGPTGATGAQGPIGLTGAAGPQGLPGAQGPAGPGISNILLNVSQVTAVYTGWYVYEVYGEWVNAKFCSLSNVDFTDSVNDMGLGAGIQKGCGVEMQDVAGGKQFRSKASINCMPFSSCNNGYANPSELTCALICFN